MEIPQVLLHFKSFVIIDVVSNLLSTGFIYGAKNNKNLKIFIDDIHLPDSDLCGTQSVNQLLRQVLDRKVIFSHSNKQCKHKTIEGLNVLAAMNSNSPLCKGKTSDISRLMVTRCLLKAAFYFCN